MSSGDDVNGANKSGSADASQLATLADTWTIDSFARLPTKAGDVLRRLHSLPDPGRRFKYIVNYQRFDDEHPTEEQLDGLYKGRLPQVMMDIALDRRLYDNFRDFHTGVSLLIQFEASYIPFTHAATPDRNTYSLYTAPLQDLFTMPSWNLARSQVTEAAVMLRGQNIFWNRFHNCGQFCWTIHSLFNLTAEGTLGLMGRRTTCGDTLSIF